MYTGLDLGDYVVIGSNNQENNTYRIQKYHKTTFQMHSQVEVKAFIKTMAFIENNRLLVGEEFGKLDIICLDTMQLLLSCQLKNEEHINEIKKMSRANEYGFATSLGLRFGKVVEDSKGKV
jgi:hypothetical protein